MVLQLIQEYTSSVEEQISIIRDDPVRPTIPCLERLGNNKDVFVLRSDSGVSAITCVSYQSEVPTSEQDLFQPTDNPNIVVFYTIWSYQPGAGRDLLLAVIDHLKSCKPEIDRFVTLSPMTPVAAKFHLKNGAFVFRENETTVNYEYKL